MVKNVLKTPSVVLIAGLPGVGKSTLAKQLGKKLDYTVLERDKFKDPFLDDADIKRDFTEDEASRAAYAIFFNIAHDLIVNQRKSVVLDCSTLYPFILERLEDLARQANTELKVILCEVDEKTRQKRLRERPKRKSQARSHLMTAEKAIGLKKLPGSTCRLITEEGKREENLKKAIAYATNKKPSLRKKIQEKLRGDTMGKVDSSLFYSILLITPAFPFIQSPGTCL